jgi:FKBP-type peptidyl-prolyl cis-trans isomerase
MFRDGDLVSVYYTGQLLDGRDFDSNIGEEALTFMVPGEYIIPGWNEGIKLMRDGEYGILIIPYQLGYGEEGRLNEFGHVMIPPYMTLVYYMKTDMD